MSDWLTHALNHLAREGLKHAIKEAPKVAKEVREKIEDYQRHREREIGRASCRERVFRAV